MSLSLFGKRKRVQKELEEQRYLMLQKEAQEEAQQKRQWQLQDQLRQAERQLEQERYVRTRQEHEQQAREQSRRERLKKEQQEAEQKEIEQKGREQRRLERLKLTSPEALRGVRDLIRTRYALDAEIWSLKGARKPDRPVVEEKMARADAVLLEIYTMVESWEQSDKVWTPQEWELARDIKERILAEGKRWWEDSPPWNEN